MELELTKRRIELIIDELPSFHRDTVIRTFWYEAQKELFRLFQNRAHFVAWEWKDSKGIWDIVLDDNEMQSLLKHFELEGEPKPNEEEHTSALHEAQKARRERRVKSKEGVK